MSRATQLFVLLLAMLGASQPGAAQWLKHPTPGIPRTADGQADLKAPAPRTADGRPDLSGMWGWQPGKYFGAPPEFPMASRRPLRAAGQRALPLVQRRASPASTARGRPPRAVWNP